MSAELYDQFAANNRIDQAITEAEAEFELTGEAIDAKTAFDELEKKYLFFCRKDIKGTIAKMD